MILYAEEALAQIDALRAHFGRKHRIEPIISLATSLAEAEHRIEAAPAAGLPAPRPYPQLARTGRLWIIVRHYWVAYAPTRPPITLAVFHDTADIPGRLP